MINIQIIILLSLAPYVAGGVLFSKGTTANNWDVEIDESSEAGSLSVNVDDESDSKGKDSEENYNDGTNIPIQSENNYGNFSNFGNQDASSNSIENGINGNLIGNLSINFERTADGFKINGRNVPGVNPYNAIEIDWYPQGGIAVNGDYKTGFEDVKYSGRTLLGPILNPFDSDGTWPSQDSTEAINCEKAPKNDVGNERVHFDMTGEEIKINNIEVGGTGLSECSKTDEISHKKNDYHSRYQNRGRLFRKPTIPIDNAIRMTYDDFMNSYENITSFNNGLNNKRKGNAKATAGDKDFSRTGVKAPIDDVGNQRLHFDMSGEGMKINGIEVEDTGSRQNSKTDKTYQKKTSYPVRQGNNIRLTNSNNINSNHVNWNNLEEQNYTISDFSGRGSSRYNTSNNVQFNDNNKGVQYNNQDTEDVQYNNFGSSSYNTPSNVQFNENNRGWQYNHQGVQTNTFESSDGEPTRSNTSNTTQFTNTRRTRMQFNNNNNKGFQMNNQGNGGVQVINSGHGGIQYNSSKRENVVYSQGGNTVIFRGEAVWINDIKVIEYTTSQVNRIEFGEDSLKINNTIIEYFDVIRGPGTIIFGQNNTSTMIN